MSHSVEGAGKKPRTAPAWHTGAAPIALMKSRRFILSLLGAPVEPTLFRGQGAQAFQTIRD